MAFSKSLRKGQIPSSCKLCEVESKISWKCLDCNILMCNRCKDRIHPNLRNAENHKVVDIKEIGQTEDVDLNNISCKKHKGQVCVMFCQECDKLVCPKCMAQIHNGHKFVEISEGYQSRIQKLKNIQDQMKLKTDKLARDKTKIAEFKITEKAKHIDAKKKIDDHIIALKRTVDKHGENLKKELDQNWKTLLCSIEKEESKVIAMEKSKADRTSLIEDLIQSKDVEMAFEMGNHLETSLDQNDEPVQFTFAAMPSFVPGEISINNVGALQHTSDIKLQVIKECTTDISGVFLISPCPDSLWISNEELIQKVQPEGNSLKVISNFNMKVVDMDITASNDLLLAPYRQSVLKQISGRTNKLTDTNFSIHPLVFTALHISKNGKVIVGARNPGEPFPVTGRRAVIVMDQEGQHQTIYEYQNNNQPIFTLPRKITTTKNGNICVVDWESNDWQRRVLVLGQEGHILNIYTGHPDVNTDDKPFQPPSIVTTPSDNIIVPNLNIGVLHVLNNTGHYITYINTRDIGIERPFNITFTTSGQVYIGCTIPRSSTDNAKLYEVKLLGC